MQPRSEIMCSIFVFDSSCDLLFSRARDQQELEEILKGTTTTTAFLPFLAARRNLKSAADNGLQVVCGRKGWPVLLAGDLEGGTEGTLLALHRGPPSSPLPELSDYVRVVASLVRLACGPVGLGTLRTTSAGLFGRLLQALSRCRRERPMASLHAVPAHQRLKENSRLLQAKLGKRSAETALDCLCVVCVFRDDAMVALARHPEGAVIDDLWLLAVANKVEGELDEALHVTVAGFAVPCRVRRVASQDGRFSALCVRSLAPREVNKCIHASRLLETSRALLRNLDVCSAADVADKLSKHLWEGSKKFNEVPGQKLPLHTVRDAIISSQLVKNANVELLAGPPKQQAFEVFLRNLSRDLTLLYCSLQLSVQGFSQDQVAQVEGALRQFVLAADLDSQRLRPKVRSRGIPTVAAMMMAGKDVLCWYHIDRTACSTMTCFRPGHIRELLPDGCVGHLQDIEVGSRFIVGVRSAPPGGGSGGSHGLEAFSWWEDPEGRLARTSAKERMILLDHLEQLLLGPATLFQQPFRHVMTDVFSKKKSHLHQLILICGAK